MFGKILFGIAVVSLFVCGLAGAAGLLLFRSTVDTQSVEIEGTAAKIIDGYTLPENFSPQYCVVLRGYSLVAAGSASGSGHIFFIQAPSDVQVNAEDLRRAAQRNDRTERHRRPQRLLAIGERQARVRGQDVTLILQEGVNGSGVHYRQLSGLFEGKGGPALVSFSAPLTEWNEETALRFINSVR